MYKHIWLSPSFAEHQSVEITWNIILSSAQTFRRIKQKSSFPPASPLQQQQQQKNNIFCGF